MEMTTWSISNTISKGSADEEMSIYRASLEDEKRRLTDGTVQEQISNEQIRKDDVLLETYHVLSDAIRGGMGSVWRVRHNGWNADLAMKRPLPRFFQEAGGTRKQEFIAECEHWIDLGMHLNIVTCYYVREIGGVPTIFSEWMSGGSLKDVVRSGELYRGRDSEVQERILDIAIQAERGLMYSHNKGLIHQDVKPGNILLTRDWDAKVADFGLAKAQSQLTDGNTSLSTGYTREYCPAEQAAGETAEAWMDVYAWALTVLEMYAGKRLWETGAEAFERMKDKDCRAEFRVQPPDKLLDILLACGLEEKKKQSFSEIDPLLTKIWQEMTGRTYNRPRIDKAVETAASLNNRALSFMDLGQPQTAKELLDRAMDAYGMSKVPRFNRSLLLYRMGETDKANYDALALAERGDVRNAWRGIIEADLDPGNEQANKDSEFGYYYLQLKEKLSEPSHPLIREYLPEPGYEATAGWLYDGKILLGLSVPRREYRTGVPTRAMRLRLVDAETGKTILNFQQPDPYAVNEWERRDVNGETHPFARVGKVCMSRNGKYAFAVNMNMQPNLTGRYFSSQIDRQEYLKKQPDYKGFAWNRAAGVHVWDGETGKYLKYLPKPGGIDYSGLEGFWCSPEDEEIVTAGDAEWNVSTGECRRVPKRKSEKTRYMFPDKYSVEVTDKRSSSEVEILLDGKVVSRYGGGQVSVDPDRGWILDTPYETSHSNYHSSNRIDFYPTLLTVEEFRFKAPMVMDRLRTPKELAEGQHRMEKEAAIMRKTEEYLESGNVFSALMEYGKLNDVYHEREFWVLQQQTAEKRDELLWKFAGKAIPTDFTRKQADLTHYKAFKKYSRLYPNRKLESGGSLFLLIPGNQATSKPAGAEISGTEETGCFRLQITGNETGESRELVFPEGIVEEAYVVANELFSVITRPIVRDTIGSGRTDETNPSGKNADRNAVRRRIISHDCLMIRMDLNSGASEQIGSGYKGTGDITFCGSFHVYPGAVIRKEGEEKDSLMRAHEKEAVAISFDARMIIGNGLYLTECKWEASGSGTIPEFLTFDNGYESRKKKMTETGITVFEPGERPAPPVRAGKDPDGKKGFFARLFGRR